MRTINKLLVLVLALLTIACQEDKQSYPTQMQRAEKILLKEPITALSMLDSIKKMIKNQPIEAQRYYDLLLFRANDICYIPHPSNDTIKKCITYYTKHFDNDKLMTAYYCMGCYYRDKKDYVKASRSYQIALNYVRQSKDFALVGRIYNQLASLSDIPKEKISFYKKSSISFARAKDDLTLMYSMRDIATSFSSENLNDSAIYYGEKAYNMALSLKDSTGIQVMDCQMADYYLKTSKINQAKHMLDNALINPHDNNDNSLYYLDWGEYYQAVNKNDSATYYYNKCLKSTTDINFKYSSYKALYDIYKKKHDFNKLIVCSDSLLSIDNENDQIVHDTEVTKQNIHFGVKRIEKENSRLNVEIGFHKILIVCLIVVILAFTIAGITLKKMERRRKEKLKKKIEDEISKTSSAMVEEKIKRINELKEKLEQHNKELVALPNMDELMAQKEKNKVAKNEFFASPAYNLLLNKIQDGKSLTDDQWKDFTIAVDKAFDNFNARLKAIYSKLSEREVRICNMIKADFNTEQMAAAICCSQSNTYNIRRRLYKKLTAKSGSAGDLNTLIAEL